MTSLDIQNGQFVVQSFLGIEGIEQLDVTDVAARGRAQDAVEHVHQDRSGCISTKEVFKGVINLGIERRGSSLRLRGGR